jgi:hypothetical protein
MIITSMQQAVMGSAKELLTGCTVHYDTGIGKAKNSRDVKGASQDKPSRLFSHNIEVGIMV